MSRKALRVLVCAHEYPPDCSGIGFVAVNVVKQLREKGHKVKVCTPVGGEIRAGSRKVIQRLGGLGIVHFWRAAANVIKRQGEEFNVIWTHNALFTKRLPAQNVLSTVHTTYAEHIKTLQHLRQGFVLDLYYRLMILIERFSFKKMKEFGYTVTNTLTRKELEHFGIGGRVPIINNGIDTKKFSRVSSKEKEQLRRRIGFPVGSSILLNVGRLAHHKEQQLLIKRFRELQMKSKSKLALRIVGDGALKEELLKEAEEARSVNCDVRLLPAVKQERLAKYYRAADYAIMPSTYEGQPLALLEGMACGLIPLLSGIPVFRKLVKDTGQGAIIDFNREDAAAEMARLLSKGGYEGRSARLAAYIREEHSWKRVAQDYERELLLVADRKTLKKE